MAISVLLHNAELLAKNEETQKSDKSRRGELYNVFRACRIDHHELSHSAILAEWLNSKGSHGQGDLFLRLFLESVDVSFVHTFQTSKAVSRTEYSTPHGRLDIFLEDSSGNAVIIENKINANDQDAQLKRYSEFAKNSYGIDRYLLLYLTLDGREASMRSGDQVAYTPISYQSTILNWINLCKMKVFDKPVLLDAFTQYEDLVKQITGQGMDRNTQEKVVAEMLREPKGTAAIIKAQVEWERTLL